MWGEIPQRIWFTEKDFLSVEATVVQPFRPSVRGRLERRGEGKRKNCHFLALSHPIAPAPSRSGLSLSTKSKRKQAATQPRGSERHSLYRVLILWLFLQFLNFKWEYWNTDIDMKRFIVTIYHYFIVLTVIIASESSWYGALVQSVYFLTAMKMVLVIYINIYMYVYIGIFE